EPKSEVPHRPSQHDWIGEYQLADREYRLRVTAQSTVIGETLEELNLRGKSGANVVAIERKRGASTALVSPTAKSDIQADDILLIDLFGRDADVEALQHRFALEAVPLTGAYFSDRSQEIGMAEVILPANSELIGKTVVGARFRTRYGLTVIGLRRGGAAHECGLLNEELKVGDTLLLIGPWKAIENLQSDGRDLGI